jgi:hypothetical protein
MYTSVRQPSSAFSAGRSIISETTRQPITHPPPTTYDPSIASATDLCPVSHSRTQSYDAPANSLSELNPKCICDICICGQHSCPAEHHNVNSHYEPNLSSHYRESYPRHPNHALALRNSAPFTFRLSSLGRSPTCPFNET